MARRSLKRFGVSIEEELLRQFDDWIERKQYENRSEAIRALIRRALTQDLWENDEWVAGSILIFYEHHKRNILDQLTEIQHEMHHCILSTVHFHLDSHHCLELIVVKGRGRELREFGDRLISVKGVKYGEFTVAPIDL